MNEQNSKLSFREKFGYGLGDTASHFAWDMAGMFLFFYYTDVYGISAAAAGTIMLAARVWDAISDPLVGIIADRTTTRWGKFRPYMLWFAVPLGATLIMLFTTPDFEQTGKIIFAACAYLMLSTFYTAVNLPFSALSGVMTSDSKERTLLNQYRFFLGFTGMFVVSLTMTFKNYLIVDDVLAHAVAMNLPAQALAYIKDFAWGEARLLDTTGTLKQVITQAEQGAFQLIATVLAAVGTVLLIFSFLSTKERIKPPKDQVNNILKDIKSVFGVRDWLILFLLGIVTFILINIQGAVVNQYFKYIVGRENDTTIFYTSTTLCLIFGVLMASPLANRFEKRNVYMVCSVLSGVLTMALYLPGPEDFYQLHITNILSKLAIAPTIPLLWAMIADTADFSEWKNRRRATGLFFSATTFAQKIGGGFAVAIAGVLLTVANYDGAAVQQTDEALASLRLMFSVIPGALYLLTGGLLLLYHLSDSQLENIRNELEQRRLAERAAA